MKGLSPHLTDDGSATIFFRQADISSLNASEAKKRYEITVATARVVGDVQLASLTERIESELRPQLQRQLLLGAARRHYARVRHDLVRKLRHAWDGSDYKITLVAQLLDKARCCCWCPRSIKHPPSINLKRHSPPSSGAAPPRWIVVVSFAPRRIMMVS